MSEPSKHLKHPTPPAGWSLPLAFWQNEVAQARERLRVIRGNAGSAGAGPERPSTDARAALDELETTFEELSVAEEELRVQHDELERAQEVLVTERARYRALFDRAPVPYVVTDAYGVIRAANEAAATMLRYRATPLTGKPLTVFTQDVSRRRLRHMLRRVVETTEPVTIALDITNRAGRVRRAELTAEAARDLHGAVVEIRWLIVDRTAQWRRARRRRARAERLEALVAERTADLRREQQIKDNLLATVSHEFRTALAAIGGFGELLAMDVHGALNQAQRSDVERILRAYQHLARIVGDLLTYSRLASAQVSIEFSDVLLLDALNGLTDLVSPQAGARNVSVSVDAVDPRLVVRADPERLRQVLLNLLSNAVKFSLPGGRVHVRCRADADHAYIDVADQGEGIPDGARDRIFEPFVRLKSRSGAAGTGLGLAIARELARAMNGDVTLAETSTLGSRFVVQLDRSTAFAEQAAPC